MRGLVRTIPGRAALAALAGVAAAVAVLGVGGAIGLALPIGAALAAIVAVVASAVVARTVTRPIANLAQRARARAEGRDGPFDATGPDEIQDLASALRRMAGAIDEDRREAEAERDRLALLVDALADAVLIAGADERIERANRAATTLFGAGLVGRRLVEVVRDHEVLDAIGRAGPGQDAIRHVERAARFQRVVARRLPEGQLLLVIQDLTNLRRLETVRRDFVANVSHELRTPLASLKAMVEALQAGAMGDREAADDFVRRIRHEVDGLAELVEDLLILGRVESGQERLNLQATPPAELLATAADRMRALVERAGVKLVVEYARDLPAVAADRDRVGQVFANLLHNATRHTGPGGQIRLRAARIDGAVAFEVRDTGDGIAPDDLDRIFERFYKGDRSRATGGTGLGLSIAKHIVEAHRGAIRAESEGPGRGASITFTLPIAGP